MDKIVLNTVPNWANTVLIIFVVVVVVSFIVFVYTAIVDNEKINFIAHTTLNGTLIVLLIFSGIVFCISFFMRHTKPYSITKMDDAIIVNSQSDWILNSTYTIVAHKNGFYYLEDTENPKSVIKLSDNELIIDSSKTTIKIQ